MSSAHPDAADTRTKPPGSTDSQHEDSTVQPSVSPVAMASTAGNAVSVVEDVPVSSFSTAARLSAQMLGSIARTSVVWLNHLLRVFAPVYRMPLRAFKPVQIRPFDNLKQRAWAHFVRQGKMKMKQPVPPSPVSPAAAAGISKEQRYQRIGAFRAIRTVYASEGILSLIHHLSPALLANVLLGTVMFGSYQGAIEAEHYVMQSWPDSSLAALFSPRRGRFSPSSSASTISSASIVMPPVSYPGILLAGSFSGLCQSFVAAPLQAVDVHYTHHHYLHTMAVSSSCHEPSPLSSSSLRPSHHQSFLHLWATEGVRGIFRGWELTAVRDTIGLGIFFCGFQLVKSLLVREEHFKPHSQLLHWMDKKESVLHGRNAAEQEDDDERSFVRRELGWSHTHIWNSFAIVVAGVAAGLSYRLVSHPFVVLQHRRDRDYLIAMNDRQRLSTARVPLLCFAHAATSSHYTHPPAYQELLELYRKDGLKFLKLDPSSSSAFSFPRSVPSFLNRVTLLFSPSVVGLLTYELSKMHEQQHEHQH